MASSSAVLGCIAHRGGGIDAPESTLAALKTAKAKGAKCVEFDVGFTSDKVAVVFHDESLSRTTNGVGRLEETSFATLRTLNATPKDHLFKDDFPAEKVPKLEEFVDECLKLDVKMIIDVKTWKQPELTVNAVVGLFAKRPELYKMAMVSSFFPHLAYLIRQRDPKIVMAMAFRPGFISREGAKSDAKRRFNSLPLHLVALMADVILGWSIHEWLWHFIGLSAILVEKDSLTPAYLQRWREKGVRVIAWTVNNSLQRAYVNNFLRCTSMSDSMDCVPLEEVLAEYQQIELKDVSDSETTA